MSLYNCVTLTLRDNSWRPVEVVDLRTGYASISTYEFTFIIMLNKTGRNCCVHTLLTTTQ